MNAEELLVTIAVATVASQLMMLELRLLPTVITTALARQSTIRVETAPGVKLASELIMPKMLVVSMSLVWVRPLGWNFSVSLILPTLYTQVFVEETTVHVWDVMAFPIAARP
jgi:hypothetical protein